MGRHVAYVHFSYRTRITYTLPTPGLRSPTPMTFIAVRQPFSLKKLTVFFLRLGSGKDLRLFHPLAFALSVITSVFRNACGLLYSVHARKYKMSSTRLSGRSIIKPLSFSIIFFVPFSRLPRRPYIRFTLHALSTRILTPTQFKFLLICPSSLLQ
jgi:hypothetical protein